jgi:15-cis-phytoene synthase
VSAASEITRQAKSNLAFALNILPRERRDDMVVFYAFCRTMDDFADDPRPAGRRCASSH